MSTQERKRSSRSWFLYLVRRADGALYTGITTDVERRLNEHAHSKRGARALRARGPLELVYFTDIDGRALASRAEHRVKALDRRSKEALVRKQPDSMALLSLLGLGIAAQAETCVAGADPAVEKATLLS